MAEEADIGRFKKVFEDTICVYSKGTTTFLVTIFKETPLLDPEVKVTWVIVSDLGIGKSVTNSWPESFFLFLRMPTVRNIVPGFISEPDGTKTRGPIMLFEHYPFKKDETFDHVFIDNCTSEVTWGRPNFKANEELPQLMKGVDYAYWKHEATISYG